MQENLVSIITPIYNGAKFLPQTVESVLAQTYKNWEMFIINDGSTDNSEELARSLAQQDTRIIVLSQKNGGSASARNNGIRHANGRYIALLDSDDVWNPNFLETQLNFMKEKNAQLVCSAHRRINQENKDILQPFFPPKEIRYNDLLKTCSISCLTGLYDTIPYGKFFFHEELRSLRDDYVYWLDILKKVGVAHGNQQILASYRMLDTSVSRKKWKVVRLQYLVYRNIEHLPIHKSFYYLTHWAIAGFLKYWK